MNFRCVFWPEWSRLATLFISARSRAIFGFGNSLGSKKVGLTDRRLLLVRHLALGSLRLFICRDKKTRKPRRVVLPLRNHATGRVEPRRVHPPGIPVHHIFYTKRKTCFVCAAKNISQTRQGRWRSEHKSTRIQPL